MGAEIDLDSESLPSSVGGSAGSLGRQGVDFLAGKRPLAQGPLALACSLPGQYFCCRPCQVEIRYLQCFDRSPRRLDEKGCLWD